MKHSFDPRRRSWALKLQRWFHVEQAPEGGHGHGDGREDEDVHVHEDAHEDEDEHGDGHGHGHGLMGWEEAAPYLGGARGCG